MFLRLKDYEGCRKYMYETSKKVLSESLEYNSSALPWIFSIALLNYATNKQSINISIIIQKNKIK